jgi:MerR family copper efflux transcriptional regulator
LPPVQQDERRLVTGARRSTIERLANPIVSREEFLQIGEVAERVGLSLRTVRYYEEVGLFTPAGRTQGGFRLYREDQVERLRLLKGMKPFGLTLSEIRELVDLIDRSDAPGAAKAELVPDLEKYRGRADERIDQLERHLSEMRNLRAGIESRLDHLDAAAE